MHRRRRDQPRLELPDELFILLGFLDLGKTFEVRMRQKFRRQWPSGPEKQQRRRLQPLCPPRRQQFRPPFLAGKILSRERQTLEVVLEKEPGPLWIRARCEILKHFGAR